MEEMRGALEAHMDQISELFERFSVEFRKNFKLQSFSDPILAFVHAVDWKEPFIIILLSFHFILFVLTIRARRNNNIQMGIFLFALFSVFMAERLNTFLAGNWTRFARQPYFDQHGIFISTLWSGPLLTISIIVLVNSLISLATLIVKWKRAELRHRMKLANQKAD